MSLTPDDIKKIAHLARLNLSVSDMDLYGTQLSNILGFIEQMNEVDTSSVEPLAHPLDVTQRLRPDVVGESDLREKYQRIAPQEEA
jgi:aspartyl-tRNA(Asn)/glutamyl-tRNA(Gln) amidotransferase subunit C